MTDVEVPVAELRARLRHYLGCVADNGGPVVITRYATRIATLAPIDPQEVATDDE
jgi:prevent-host-death family protein